MTNRKIIFIGPAGGGGVPRNGASAKNYHLIKFFREKSINVVSIDTENWRKNPYVLLKLGWTILCNPKAKYIVASNNMSSYRVLRIMSFLLKKRSVIYWVIGGSIADWIKDGRVKRAPFELVEFFLVEGKKMQYTLASAGFSNSVYVPNFKCIDYIPNRNEIITDRVRFVFLSRVIPEKGCDTIIDAVVLLNAAYKNRFIVDFYGPFESEYESEFKHKIATINNVAYKGFLDLRDQKNYDTLAKYDVMLFPTYWAGEGFPGIIIDAFIAGLPVIASDWSLNADIIENGKTGVILRDNNVKDLAFAMSAMIENPDYIGIMSKQCQESAMKYSINNVVSDDLLNKLGLC